MYGSNAGLHVNIVEGFAIENRSTIYVIMFTIARVLHCHASSVCLANAILLSKLDIKTWGWILVGQKKNKAEFSNFPLLPWPAVRSALGSG